MKITFSSFPSALISDHLFCLRDFELGIHEESFFTVDTVEVTSENGSGRDGRL